MKMTRGYFAALRLQRPPSSARRLLLPHHRMPRLPTQWQELERISPKLINECGTAVKPSLRTVSLGGSVGDATVVQIEDIGCYGSAGSLIVILKSEGGQLRPIFENSAGEFRVLPGRHLGVSDIEIGGPGLAVPIWRWNGRASILEAGPLILLP